MGDLWYICCSGKNYKKRILGYDEILPFLIWKELSKGYIIIGVVLRGKKYRQMSKAEIRTSEHQQMANHLIQTEQETYPEDGTSHHGLDGYLKESY